jgi:WD40 repeat protein
MRWAGVGFLVVAAVGCRGLLGTKPRTGPEAADAASSGSSDTGSIDAGTGDAADASQPLCPSLAAPNVGTETPIAGWSTPTAVPFSCAPMPDALFLPRPGLDVAGAYARCSSFADARAVSVAVNNDGSLIALIGIDGIARIIDVASRTVVGVLAPPRASVDLAAFSPDGDAILTVARGERQVTLWRADTFAPIWTTTLPGHLYDNAYGGGAALSPDGAAALVSPGGGDLYLLDTATGAIRVTSSQLSGVVLNVAYGWHGRRIALLTAPVIGMCTYSPHGGRVTTLDPDTLAPLATPMSWPLTGDESPEPGQLLVAADADLIITTPLDTYPNPPVPKAFRISDGSPLPAPPIESFPLALSPDGAAALMGSAGALQLVRLADGASIATTTAVAPTAVAFSADGSTIAAGSSGDNLLGIWQPVSGPMVPTCTANSRASAWNVRTSLSADGATIAVDWGSQIRVLRRADGSRISTIDHGDQSTAWLTLSPDARYVIGEFSDLTSPDYPMAVFRTSDGAQVADLGLRYSSQAGVDWTSFAFLPDGPRLDGALMSSTTDTAVMQVDLETGVMAPTLHLSGQALLVGMSGNCPLLLDSHYTLVRACDGHQPLPVVTNTATGVVSLDSSVYLGPLGRTGVTGTLLWNITSPSCVLRTYPPRPEEATWSASEDPVAVSAHGGRVITVAQPHASCGEAPGFTSRVHDVAADTVIDDLPPNVTSSGADLAVLAYGPVLWCTR